MSKADAVQHNDGMKVEPDDAGAPAGLETSFEVPVQAPLANHIVDYVNHGFNLDTWRLYHKRQQEMRREVRNLLAQQHVSTFQNVSCNMGGGAAIVPRRISAIASNGSTSARSSLSA